MIRALLLSMILTYMPDLDGPENVDLSKVGMFSVAPYLTFEKDYLFSVSTQAKTCTLIVSDLTDQKPKQVVRIVVSADKGACKVASSGKIASSLLPTSSKVAALLCSLQDVLRLPTEGKTLFMCSMQRFPKSSEMRSRVTQPVYQASVSWVPAKPGDHILVEFDDSGNVLSVIGGA